MSAPAKFKINESLLAKITAAPMDGFTTEMLTQHFDLYKGYVNQSNALLAEIHGGSLTGAALIDRRRRLGFEIDGIFMHELFFENLTPKSAPAPAPVQEFFAKHCGSFEKFIAEVENAGSTRGVGWIAVMYDNNTDFLTVTWVEEHHLGVIVNSNPLLLIDCWEHAFIRDFKTTGRGPYVKASLKYIDWEVVGKRIQAVTSGRTVCRAIAK